MVFKEIESDLRVVIGSNEAEHWLFVINHVTKTLQAAHPIAADYDVDPTKLKLSMSSDRFRYCDDEGEETYHQRYQVCKLYNQGSFYVIDEFTVSFAGA